MLGHRLYEYGKFLKSLTGTNLRLLWGMWKLTKLPQPAITVFGSSRVPLKSIHGERAHALGKKLALGGFSIITGGGPGIMEAANRGAYEAAHGSLAQFPQNNGFTSFGIGLTRLNKEKSNPYVQDYITMDHFFGAGPRACRRRCRHRMPAGDARPRRRRNCPPPPRATSGGL